MSAPFRPYDTNQPFLLPPSLREWLGSDHEVYFLMDVVAELDLSEIYRYYDFAPVKNEKGERIGERPKTNRGMPAYEPRMMVGLLLYAYVKGTPGSRVIEKKCQEDVAFRIISGNQQPHFTVISEFRRVHLKALSGLFVQGLTLCQKAGLVNLGDVALDGTKVKANASKHKAMSYDRMLKKEAELKAQIEELLRQAQEADQQEDKKYGKDKRGDELPEELARRESRLRKIQEAKAALEQEARQEAERKRQERDNLERRAEQEGRRVPGRPAEIPQLPDPKSQRNFTDPESRIMKNSDKAFIQGYNAQAAVDGKTQVIVAYEVTHQAADAPHAVEMMDQVKENTGRYPDRALQDAGYFSEANVQAQQARGIEPFVATARQKHSDEPLVAPRGPIPKNATVKDRMRRKLQTLRGKAVYALRKTIVEPVFGQIRTRGLQRFWLRGLQNVHGEWSLWCTTHNLLKLWRSGRAEAVLTGSA
ncbi:MAG: IS1182 family transposase [Nitrospiraceae bacterium]